MPCKECIKAYQEYLKKNHMTYKKNKKIKAINPEQVNKSIDPVQTGITIIIDDKKVDINDNSNNIGDASAVAVENDKMLNDNVIINLKSVTATATATKPKSKPKLKSKAKPKQKPKMKPKMKPKTKGK